MFVKAKQALAAGKPEPQHWGPESVASGGMMLKGENYGFGEAARAECLESGSLIFVG